MGKKQLAKNDPYMKMVVGILKAGQIIDHKVSDVLKEFGITHIQFNILRILEAEKPAKLSLVEISNGLLFKTSDVSRLIDRLVVRGLINRVTCPNNRRRVEIDITESGLEVIRMSIPKIELALDGYYRDKVNKDERERVTEIMKRIQ